MTTGQQADPAVSAAIDAWHAACHAEATIEDGMGLVVEAVRAADALRAADLPPLAELVTDEDVRAATDAAFPGFLGLPTGMVPEDITRRMRAALEAYRARLVARLGSTP